MITLLSTFILCKKLLVITNFAFLSLKIQFNAPVLKSWSLISSIENVTSKSDRRVDSKWLNHRNHHTDGQTQISNFIKMLFGDPELNDDSEDAFEKYIYLTQLSQAVCTTEQVNGIFS